MKFNAKEMKTNIDVMKRFVTDKKKGIMTVKSNGDGLIHLYGGNKFVHFYTTVKSLSEDVYAFTVLAHEFGKMLTDNDKKGGPKHTELECKLNKKSMKEILTNTSFKIEPVEWDEKPYYALNEEAKELPPKEEYQPAPYDFLPPSPWGYVQEEEVFLRVLKEGYEAIKKNVDIRTVYLALRSGKSMATEEKRAHLYRLSENFPFETIYLHRDVLAALSATIKKGDIVHKKEMEGFYLAYKGWLFEINDKQSTVFPSLRNIVVTKNRFRFEVDASLFAEKMKDYKAEVKSFVCSFRGDELHIIPNHESYSSAILPVTILEGEPKECKFTTEVIKGLLGSYTNKVVVEDVEFKNLKEKTGYLWRIYQPQQLNVSAGITRPNWPLLKALHAMGELKNVSTQHELHLLVERLEKEGRLPKVENLQ